MINRLKYIGLLCLMVMLLFGIIAKRNIWGKNKGHFLPVNRKPQIDPDYSDVILPPNIAPLNFTINEVGKKFQVNIVSTQGEAIEISRKTNKIRIPIKKWQKLLNLNRGQKIQFKISIMDMDGSWKQFKPAINEIAHENIDSHLAYRIIDPAYTLWNEMGIFQRNLQTFDEDPILLNRATEGNCMNCHNFCNNNPEYMMLHLRAGKTSGTLIARDGRFEKVNTATKFTKAGAYPSWHPNGNIIAYSMNKLEMFFHAKGEPRDVLDRGADLILYDINTSTVTTSPQISDPERMESFPCWAADGRSLYFCSAPKFELFIEGESFRYDEIFYDLMRIPYNPSNGSWGELETVLSSSETGMSISMPRVSPDGRYVLFCMARCGNFPIYMPDSDLFLLDLNTGDYRSLQINSDQAETFHSWASNSRWFVFSSKRRDGISAHPYFAYVDEQGKVHKPFIMPQKDPSFYRTFVKTYNVPELVNGPVLIRPQNLVKIAYNDSKKINATLDPAVTHLRIQKDATEPYRPAPQ